MADLSKLRFNGTDYNVKDASAPLRKFTNYSKTGNLPITSDDTTQTAIGKLEKALDDKINTSAKGTSNGVAELDANGKVPSSQLPSYVDDVLEYSAKSSFPATGETGKIYVDTTTNKTYRWSGSAYVEISESLALGETSSTAYRGDRGKAAYDHSQITNGNPHGTTGANTNLTGYSKGSSKDAVAATDTVNAAIAKHENRINANQTNILYACKRVGKNLFDITSPYFTRDTTVTPLDNGGATLSCSSAMWTQYFNTIPTEIGKEYKVVLYIDSISGVGSDEFIVSFEMVDPAGSTYAEFINITTAGTHEATFTATVNTLCVAILLNNSATAKTSSANVRIMICEKNIYDIVGSDYERFSLPNYDLTVLESENRAALVECVDEGAKNRFNFDGWKSVGVYRGSKTVSGNSVTITSSQNDAFTYVDIANGYPQDALIYVSTGDKLIFTWDYTNSNSQATDEVMICGNGAYTSYVHVLASAKYLEYTVPSGITYITIRLGVATSGDSATYSNLMICTKSEYDISPAYEPYALPNTDLTRMMTPFFTVPINHNMIYRGQNLGETFTEAQDTALSSGNFTDLYLGDYWTKTVTIPAGTYTGGDGESVDIPEQTNITLKAVIADFDTFYCGYASERAGINTHHAAVIVTGFVPGPNKNLFWNKTNSTVGGYVNSLTHKWLAGSALPQIETWFGSAKVLAHQKLLTNAITGDTASDSAWSSQKISLLSENQLYGSKVWGGSYDTGEAFKHLNVFNHIDANLMFGNMPIWLRDIASATKPAFLYSSGFAGSYDAAGSAIAPAALILLS